MAKLIPVPSVSSPSVQDEEGVIEDEKQPILGSRESGLKKGVKRQDSVVDVVKHASTWNWRNLIVLATLVLAYCFVGAAYSVIGPFFPSEVGLRWYLALRLRLLAFAFTVQLEYFSMEEQPMGKMIIKA